MAARTKAPAAVTLVEVEMSVDKETAGAVRYADLTEGSVVPTLYIRKDAFGDEGFPQTIKVTVTVS